MSEETMGAGYSFVEVLDEEVKDMMDHARPRMPVFWGRSENFDALKLRIPVPINGEPLLHPIDSTGATSYEIARAALAIRNMVEWTAWSDATAFPLVKERARPGEPLGQCLVTARFAKDYFTDSKLTEVRVRQGSELVGPHVILSLPSKNMGDIALDLTPDQALALGEIPLPVKQMNRFLKFNLVPFSDPRCPYEVVRYQSDEELAGKKSRPLDHTRLLKELIAFANGHESVARLESHATRISLTDIPPDVCPEMSEILALLMRYENQPHLHYEAQAGVITSQEFKPTPEWLWETSGLAGYRNARIFDRGFIQELLVAGQDAIFIINLVGVDTPYEILHGLRDITHTDKSRTVRGQPLIARHTALNRWDGPIFVEPK